ncbi:MAG: hypothetical protein SGBAC_007937 [Bacillariaceae sp.]
MTTHTISNIEERLKATRKEVANLEALLHRLKLEETSQRQRQRQRRPSKQHQNDNLNDESETSSFLQGSTLQLVVEWLDPINLVQCLLVSRRWKEDIDLPRIWERAGSRFIPELWKAMNLSADNDNSTLQTTPTVYKKIILSILEKPRRQVDVIEERLANSKQVGDIQDYWLPSTTLLPQKVFLIVDAHCKATGRVFGSWHKSFAHWVPSEMELGFQMIDVHNQQASRGDKGAVYLPAEPLQGTLDDHFAEFYNPDPLEDVPTYIYDSIAFSFRCVRTDTGESLHLGNDQDFDQYDTVLWAYLDTDIGGPTAQNDAGCRARELWSLKQFKRAGVCLRFNVRPIPSVEDCGNTLESSWHGMTYLLDGLECDFVAYRQDGSYEDFKNLQELLVSLDGYLWN